MSADLREVPPALLTANEACESLTIGLSTLYDWISKGKLPRDAVLRVGNGKRQGVRVKAWWVEAYLREGRMPRVRQIGRRRT